MEDSASAKSPELFDRNSAIARDLSKSRCKSAAFIDDTILAISGDCSFVMLIRSGEESGEIHSPEYRMGGEIRPSRGGQRFVFSRTKMKERPSRITSLELCVYDLATRRIVFTTVVFPLPQQKFAFAISPDGSLLASQTDGLVRCGALLLRSDSVRSFDLEHGFNELRAAERLSSGAEAQRQICLNVGAKAATPKTFMRQTVVS